MAARRSAAVEQSSLFGDTGVDRNEVAVRHDDVVSEPLEAVMYCDGGSRGNPGPAAIGAVVFAAVGEPSTRLAEVSECIGVQTNNVAEYRAFLAGLDAARAVGVSVLTVRADSKLLIEQVKGNYKVKHPNLRPLHAEAVRKLRDFSRVTLEHVRREFNKDADALVNRALDAAQRQR